MNLYAVTFVASLIGSIFPIHAVAEEYDYDISVSYGNSNTDIDTPLAFLGGDPPSPFGTRTTSTESDSLEVSGTWYYSGLVDNEGPKSRAAFLGRASSASLAFSYTDKSTFFSSTGLTSPPWPPGLPTSPPSSGTFDDTSRDLEADLRHVWQSSGWYGLAGVARSEHYAGVGKYIGDATALDFKVTMSDAGPFDSTDYALSLSHIGALGSEWQYAADLEFSMSDSDVNDDGKSYLAGLSLFPTSNLEFGVQLIHQESEFSPDWDSYKGFAGWFVRDDIEVRAWYQDNDFDGSPFTDLDSNQFGIGVNMRF